MNGRIIELARQATGKQVVGASDLGNWDVIERLAELIVQECIEIVHKETDDSVRVETAIQTHFGVE